MNLVFLAQGSALKIFHRLLPYLRQELDLETIGFYVADRHFFEKYTHQYPELLDRSFHYLKEWELLAVSKKSRPIHSDILAWEKKYGTPTLWPALVCDRRISQGKYMKYRQDYDPQFPYGDQLKLIQATVPALENFISEIKPHASFGFNMVTYGEFLYYLIAKQRGLPYWQLRNTKIANFMALMPDPLRYSNYLAEQKKIVTPSADHVRHAARYLQSAQAQQSIYEGHVKTKPPRLTALFEGLRWQQGIEAAGLSLQQAVHGRADYQSGGFSAWLRYGLQRPVAAWWQHRRFTPRYFPIDQLEKINYAFYPLHTEPEVALSVYGPFYQNQIETIRNIAQSLPMTWRLAVKDHPRSLGHRKSRYLEKLLAIPNVVLISPYESSYRILEKCKLAVTVSGWVGFEAVVSRKPVITLGECSSNALPRHMVRRVTSLTSLPQAIPEAIAQYRYDEPALLKHITTIIATSCPVDMYSNLLQKKNRHTSSAVTGLDSQLKGLAQFLVSRIAK